MSLTNAMLISLGNDIRSRAVSLGWNLNTMAAEIAAWYNQFPASAFIVWRTSVSPDEWRDAIMNGGGATQLDALTSGKRDSLLWSIQGILNPSKSNVRTAIIDFCGTQTTLKTSMIAVQKRNATRIEQLLATGVGTVDSPASMSFEGALTYVDVESALSVTEG